MEIREGMLARSKAGHDAGKIYVIIETDDAYVYLSDGRLRPMQKLKKKKKKHIQPIGRQYEISGLDDAQIRSILKEFQKEEEI